MYPFTTASVATCTRPEGKLEITPNKVWVYNMAVVLRDNLDLHVKISVTEYFFFVTQDSSYSTFMLLNILRIIIFNFRHQYCNSLSISQHYVELGLRNEPGCRHFVNLTSFSPKGIDILGKKYTVDKIIMDQFFVIMFHQNCFYIEILTLFP